MDEKKKLIEGTGFADMIKKQLTTLKHWVKPKPADPWYITFVKMLYKGIALLLLVALSPVILLVLILVFFAAL